MLFLVVLHYKIRGRPAQARARPEPSPKIEARRVLRDGHGQDFSARNNIDFFAARPEKCSGLSTSMAAGVGGGGWLGGSPRGCRCVWCRPLRLRTKGENDGEGHRKGADACGAGPYGCGSGEQMAEQCGHRRNRRGATAEQAEPPSGDAAGRGRR
jgi:hypothetical protein